MNAGVQPSSQAAVDAPYLLRTDRDGVVTLTFNRGDRFNPLSSAMLAALQSELDAIACDSAARVVVLTGAGRGFCGGHDLKEMRAHGSDLSWQRNLFESCSKMMLSIINLPQPVIAKVHGVAAAAGCQLVSMCDLAIATEDAKFALPGVNNGIFCSTPGVGVGRNMLRKQTMEMLLTGEQIDGTTAAVRGLVNRAVPAAALDAEVARLAATICARSGAVIAAGKKAFYRQLDLSIEEAYALATDTMVC
ncbi:MAG: enoyl-CoA hydratase, partial [Burkholderiales bacterium]